MNDEDLKDTNITSQERAWSKTKINISFKPLGLF